MTTEKKFLVDSSALMNLANNFYTFEIAPMFWRWANEQLKSGRLVMLRVVSEEIARGNDDLVEWVKAFEKGLIYNEREDADAFKVKTMPMIEVVKELGFKFKN